MSGLSNPSRRSIWWTYAAGTCPPSAASIGLPGATRRSRKTSVSRMNTIGRTSASRVMRYVLREVTVTTRAYWAALRTEEAPRSGRLSDGRDLLLRDQPEAHVVRRVKGRIDALDALLGDSDHVPLPVRDRRQGLGPEDLHLLQVRVPGSVRRGRPLLRNQLVHRLVGVAVVIEGVGLVEADGVVVGVRIVREPAELERPVHLAERAAVLRPLGRLQRHLEQARRVERPLDLHVLIGRRATVVRGRPPEGDRH